VAICPKIIAHPWSGVGCVRDLIVPFLISVHTNRKRSLRDIVINVASTEFWCRGEAGVNPLKPTSYGMHQQVEYFNNCTAHTVFMCFMFV
jgi:hypothetical protein